MHFVLHNEKESKVSSFIKMEIENLKKNHSEALSL